MAIKITYKTKDGNARVLLNHTLYGRLVYKNYRGRKHAYYVQGMLDDKKFSRHKHGGEVIVYDNIDVEYFKNMLSIFGEVTMEEIDVHHNPNFITGAEYWKNKAQEKGLPLRIRKRTRK